MTINTLKGMNVKKADALLTKHGFHQNYVDNKYANIIEIAYYKTNAGITTEEICILCNTKINKVVAVR